MKAADFVLSLIDAFEGHVKGRSLLQKRAYFVSVLTGVESDIGFLTHYSGPYSATVDNAVSRLKSLRLLNQSEIAPSRFEIKRYEYRLTNEGIKAAAALKQSQEYGAVANACQAVVKADELTLSIAARAHFTLKKRGQAMSSSHIAREAQRYNSTMKKASLDAAVQFISQLKLDLRSNPN